MSVEDDVRDLRQLCREALVGLGGVSGRVGVIETRDDLQKDLRLLSTVPDHASRIAALERHIERVDELASEVAQARSDSRDDLMRLRAERAGLMETVARDRQATDANVNDLMKGVAKAKKWAGRVGVIVVGLLVKSLPSIWAGIKSWVSGW